MLYGWHCGVRAIQGEQGVIIPRRAKSRFRVFQKENVRFLSAMVKERVMSLLNKPRNLTIFLEFNDIFPTKQRKWYLVHAN